MSHQVHLLENPHQSSQYDYPEQDPRFEGRPMDERIKRGPLHDRGCHDVAFILLYILMWALMIFIAHRALKTGDPQLMLSPFDMNGNHCGYGLTANYPYSYIVDLNEYYCVTSCPKETGVPLNCYDCTLDVPYTSNLIITLCYPTSLEFQAKIAEILNLSGSEKFFSDIEETWPVIIGCAGVALIISLILTYLIKFTARCIVWGIILLYLIIVAGIGTAAFLQANDIYFNEYKYIEDDRYLKAIAYTAWGIAGLSLLLIICLFNKINLAIAVLKAAADFTRDVWQAIFVPIVMCVFIIAFSAFWLIISMYIYSSGDMPIDHNGPFVAINWNPESKYELLIYLFGLFWNCELAIAFSQFVIASSCCMWYFSHMGNTLEAPICRSVWRALVHHIGSLLLGSLILAIVQIKAVKDGLINNGAGENACISCAFKCCKCVVRCFEQFIRFLNQNAYIMMGLTGQSFCNSAYDAFYLISRNVLKVAVTHGLGQLFEFIGTLFITAASSLICYLFITEYEEISNKISSPLAPTIAFVIVSYVIGALFMNLYGMGTDSILLCYLADYELHRSEGGAKSIPPTLKEFLHEYT